MSLEISFPDAADADANQFARELRTALASVGVPTSAIKLQRTNAEHMDVGSVVEVLKTGVEALLAMHAAVRLGTLIHDFSKRTGTTVKVKSPIGKIEITTASASSTQLADILKKIAELHRDQPKQ